MVKKVTYQPAGDEIDVSFDDDQSEKTDHDVAMDDLIEELSNIENVHQINLYRKNDKTKKMDYLDTFAPDAFDNLGALHAYVRDEWGAGEYRLMSRIKGKLILNRPIVVCLPKSKTSATYTPNPRSDTGNNQLVMEVLNRMDKMQEQIMRLSTQQHQLPQSQFDRSAFLAELVTYKELFGASNQPRTNSSTAEFIEMFKLAKELALNGNSDNSSDFWSSVTPALTKLAEKVVEEPPQSTEKPIQAKISPQPLNPMQQRANSVRRLLVSVSEANEDSLPAYADILAAQYYEYLPMLESPTWFENLCKFFPPALQSKDNFVKLREILLSEEDEEIEEINEDPAAEPTKWNFRDKPNDPIDEEIEG